MIEISLCDLSAGYSPGAAKLLAYSLYC